MSEIDLMKQAEEEFLDAVDTAAKKLARAVRHSAAQTIFRQLGMADPDAGEPISANVLKPYIAMFGDPSPFASDTPRKDAKARAKTVTADAMVASLVAYVKKHPGLRIEQINARLDTKTGDLRTNVNKAIASGKLLTKGYGRSRKYYPGKKA